jgi:hypothetical protein
MSDQIKPTLLSQAAKAGFSLATIAYWKEWLECHRATDLTPEQFVQFIKDREDEVGSIMDNSVDPIWRVDEEDDE